MEPVLWTVHQPNEEFRRTEEYSGRIKRKRARRCERNETPNPDLDCKVQAGKSLLAPFGADGKAGELG